MPIEEVVKKQIIELISQSRKLKFEDEYHQALSSEQVQECSGWLAAAMHIVEVVCPNSESAYRKRAEKIAERQSGWAIQSDVGEFGFLLTNLYTLISLIST